MPLGGTGIISQQQFRVASMVSCRIWPGLSCKRRTVNHRDQVRPSHLAGGKSGGGSPGTAAGPFIARSRRIPGIVKREEFDMSDPLDWNAKTIAEFRANEGRVGGNFEGTPMVLLHHRGRKSGREYVTPTMYLPHDTRPDIIYVFATKAGAPANPDWYRNLAAAGNGRVERGTETYQVTVRELVDAERDRIYAEQARRYPGFAEYERQTAGVRTIPVLELQRA
jgi:deazaflavin-dependent oxidoreductase (nitroreductase family)